MVISNIILSNERIEQTFNYENKFQIFPIQNKSLESHTMFPGGLHPLVVEVNLDDISDEYLSSLPLKKDFAYGQLGLQRVREIAFLLNGISVYSFEHQALLEAGWFNTSKFPFSVDSVWGYRNCVDTTLEYQKEKFTDLNNIVIEKKLPYNYSTPLAFFDKLVPLIKKYYSLEGNAKKYFEAALYLYYIGNLQFSKIKSMAFASMISAIETLTYLEHIETTVEKCEECGQDRFRITKKFIDFVKKYSGRKENEIKKIASNLYSKRSGLLHMGQILEWDRITLPWEKTNSSADATLLSQVRDIANKCIVNYLYSYKENANEVVQKV